MRNRRSLRQVWCVITCCAIAVALASCAQQGQESATAAPPRDSTAAPQSTAPSSPIPKTEPTPAQESRTTTEAPRLPDDFPLPIYEGFTVKNTIRTTTSDAQGAQVEIIGDAAPETVAQFYEAEFKRRGLEVSKMTQKTGTGEEVLVLGMSSTITAGIAATKEQNRTRVILSWSEKK